MKSRPFVRLAKILKESRISAGFVQADVAKKLRFDQQFISNWERGISSPPLRSLKKIAALYKIPLDKLHEAMLEDGIDRVKRDLDEVFRKLGS